MNKNTIVGWVALLGLIFLAFMIVAGIAAAVDSPKSTTCTGDVYTVTCVTR